QFVPVRYGACQGSIGSRLLRAVNLEVLRRRFDAVELQSKVLDHADPSLIARLHASQREREVERLRHARSIEYEQIHLPGQVGGQLLQREAPKRSAASSPAVPSAADFRIDIYGR